MTREKSVSGLPAATFLTSGRPAVVSADQGPVAVGAIQSVTGPILPVGSDIPAGEFPPPGTAADDVERGGGAGVG